MQVSVTCADDIFKIPFQSKVIRACIKRVCAGESVKKGSVGIIFANYSKIKELNKRFLNHNYSTDVITFELQEPGDDLEGEIYVCYEVAETQAREFGVAFHEELLRLIVHGLLHLAGYDDKEDHQRERMRVKGEYYLQQLYDSGIIDVNETIS
ncbi:rRNA maturation RNase YbeY [candidate division KSB1 bacterium]|nr:rRNA maturation RNase YbeY [candidate division KSB1 bacterium]